LVCAVTQRWQAMGSNWDFCWHESL